MPESQSSDLPHPVTSFILKTGLQGRVGSTVGFAGGRGCAVGFAIGSFVVVGLLVVGTFVGTGVFGRGVGLLVGERVVGAVGALVLTSVQKSQSMENTFFRSRFTVPDLCWYVHSPVSSFPIRLCTSVTHPRSSLSRHFRMAMT